jgi:hypothetical protein
MSLSVERAKIMASFSIDSVRCEICIDNKMQDLQSVRVRGFQASKDYYTAWWQSSWFILRRCLVRISAGTPVIVTDVFHGFPQSLHSSPGVISGLGENCYLSYPFKFITHLTIRHYRTRSTQILPEGRIGRVSACYPAEGVNVKICL